MALSLISANWFRSLIPTSLTPQTVEQRRENAEQALNTMIIDFLETENRHLTADSLFTQSSAIIKDCKDYGVDLNSCAVNLLVYEITLTENYADIFLTTTYKELAQALLNLLTDCDRTEIAKSLMGLNAPIEILVRLIEQGADKGVVLAQLVIASQEGKRSVAQVTALLKQQHPLSVVAQYNFAAQFEKISVNYLDSITRQAVKDRQDDFVIQLLLYGADHRSLFPRQELSLVETIEEIRLQVSAQQIEKNTLTDRLRVTLNVLLDELATSVQHAAFTRAVLINLLQVGATFRGWLNRYQAAVDGMERHHRPYLYRLNLLDM